MYTKIYTVICLWDAVIFWFINPQKQKLLIWKKCILYDSNEVGLFLFWFFLWKSLNMIDRLLHRDKICSFIFNKIFSIGFNCHLKLSWLIWINANLATKIKTFVDLQHHLPAQRMFLRFRTVFVTRQRMFKAVLYGCLKTNKA